MNMKRTIIGLFLPILLAGCAATGSPSEPNALSDAPSQADALAVSLADTHVHGLAVDRGNSSRIYIATHHGLLVWQETQGLTKVGSSRDDFMGFSAHPTDPQILFRSGHPVGGGTLGLEKSIDTGKSWDKVSNGSPTGPADFHTMTVHPANPEHIYGWFGGRIHRSLDGGENWTVIPEQMSISSIAGDPSSNTTVYTGTQNGLLMSTDRGETWIQVSTQQPLGPVLDIEPDPSTNSLLLALQDGRIMRLFRNPDGGWGTSDLGALSSTPIHLALDPKNSQTLYAFTESHALYRSSDGGATWQLVF